MLKTNFYPRIIYISHLDILQFSSAEDDNLPLSVNGIKNKFFVLHLFEFASSFV